MLASAWTWVGGAVALAAVGYVTTQITKRLWDWFVKAIADSTREAITDTVQPQLSAVEDRLAYSLEQLRVENRVDHQTVADRLTALEVRVAALESATNAVT